MDGPMAQRLIRVMRELTPELILTPTMGGGLPLNAFANRMETPIIVLPLPIMTTISMERMKIFGYRISGMR